MRYIFLFLLLLSNPALAYVGPGPGLMFLESFYALAAGIVIALFFVLLYPIRLLMKRAKKSKDASKETPEND